ncbi:MAG: Gfo/Idh/MocA family oxidoreductase, partial [Ilumatobacteraceae bacterium]
MSVRWGIAGPGAMAVGFANDLVLVDGAELAAVGSRSIDRAWAFGERFDVPSVHGSYAALAADPSVDIVYVATPQSSHEHDTLRFLEAGKHVLCEKPFALNAAQGSRMIDAARQRDLFLMEAMWARFLPSYRKLVALLAEGAIG